MLRTIQGLTQIMAAKPATAAGRSRQAAASTSHQNPERRRSHQSEDRVRERQNRSPDAEAECIAYRAASGGSIGPDQGPGQEGGGQGGHLDVCGGVNQSRMDRRDQAGEGRHRGSFGHDFPHQPDHAQHEQATETGLSEFQNQQRPGRLDPAHRVGRRDQGRVDRSLLGGGAVGPQEVDREPPAREQVPRNFAMFIGAVWHLMGLQHQHGRRSEGDGQDDEGPGSSAVEHPCRLPMKGTMPNPADSVQRREAGQPGLPEDGRVAESEARGFGRFFFPVRRSLGKLVPPEIRRIEERQGHG